MVVAGAVVVDGAMVGVVMIGRGVVVVGEMVEGSIVLAVGVGETLEELDSTVKTICMNLKQCGVVDMCDNCSMVPFTYCIY